MASIVSTAKRQLIFIFETCLKGCCGAIHIRITGRSINTLSENQGCLRAAFLSKSTVAKTQQDTSHQILFHFASIVRRALNSEIRESIEIPNYSNKINRNIVISPLQYEIQSSNRV